MVFPVFHFLLYDHTISVISLVLTCSSLITTHFHNGPHTPVKSARHNLQLEVRYRLGKIDIRAERETHAVLSSY